VTAAAPRHRVEGSNVAVGIVEGDVATILLHVARRYHYELDGLEQAELTGHTVDRTVAAAFESNYLSGTAISVRPVVYPLGVEGGFFPQEQVVIRDILADCEGVVRWGGDQAPAKESHFQIDVRPGAVALARVASKIRGWSSVGDVGAGATDPLAPGRRSAARSLEERQAA
jgi:hypothetical protein